MVCLTCGRVRPASKRSEYTTERGALVAQRGLCICATPSPPGARAVQSLDLPPEIPAPAEDRSSRVPGPPEDRSGEAPAPAGRPSAEPAAPAGHAGEGSAHGDGCPAAGSAHAGERPEAVSSAGSAA
jgi:hypothetical protein